VLSPRRATSRSTAARPPTSTSRPRATHWYTAAPVDVTVSHGLVVGANTDPTIDHGSVLVMSGESTVTPTDIAISHLMITDSRASATRDVGVISYGAAPANVVLSRFTFTGGPASAYQGNAPAGSFHTVD